MTTRPTPLQDPNATDPDSDVVLPQFAGGESAEDIISTLQAAGFNKLAQTILLIIQEFPDKAEEFWAERVNGWVNEIQSGTGRNEDDVRDDIFRVIVGQADLMERYGIDEATAIDIINGGNEGGLNFGEFIAGTDVGGDQTVSPGFTADQPDPEDLAGVGTAPVEDDPDTPEDESAPGLQILTSQNMKWFFDDDANKWFVGYTLPGSGRLAVFEADATQMDLLFGAGMRPTSYELTTLDSLVRDPMTTFSGDISEMEGVGQFEDQYHRMVTLALDGGELPPWAQQDGAAMDILYLSEAEDKPMSWVLDQLSQTDSFKQRFPGLARIQEQANVTLEAAIGGFLEFEAGARQSLISAGLSAELATPEVIGNLIEKGHSLTTVDTTVKAFDRMKKFAPAMDAFNSILGAQGLPPISTVQDMFDFVVGSAPNELYDVWEASTLSEQAAAVGLDRFFSADDAIQVALQTAGSLTTESVTAAMQKSAEFALRLRHELDVTKFDLDHEDLIDMNLGQPLRSGRSVAEVGANIQRVLASAAQERQKQTQAFTGFSSAGVPQARSFGSLRQTS